MTKLFRTKNARRLFNEVVVHHDLSATQAGIIAANVDDGRMKMDDARLAAALTADWNSASLQDYSTDTVIEGKLKLPNLADSMAKLHGGEMVDGTFSKSKNPQSALAANMEQLHDLG